VREFSSVQVRSCGVIAPAVSTAGELLARTLGPAAAGSAPLLVPRGDLESAACLPTKEIRKVDRFSLLALVAARRALAAGGLNGEQASCGVVTGNMFAGWTFTEPQLRALHGAGLEEVSPYLATAWFPAAPQGQITIHLGLKGFAKTVTTDRCSGSQAIGLAYERILTGRSNLLLAGGVEAPVTPLVQRALTALTPSGALCEGAAFLLLAPAVAGQGLQILAHRARAIPSGARWAEWFPADLARFLTLVAEPGPLSWLVINAPPHEEPLWDELDGDDRLQPLAGARRLLVTSRIGESLGASGALAAVAAVAALAQGRGGESAIVASWGHQCSDFLWLRREPGELENPL
jgi:hypothetical protein